MIRTNLSLKKKALPKKNVSFLVKVFSFLKKKMGPEGFEPPIFRSEAERVILTTLKAQFKKGLRPLLKLFHQDKF